MGQRLCDYYEQAGRYGGLRGKVRLAALTGISSTQAQSTPDGPSILSKFGSALAAVQREFGTPDKATNAAGGEPATGGQCEAPASELRRRISLLVDLTAQRALAADDLQKTLARATEVSAFALDVARASIWLLEQAAPGVPAIRCADLFERASGLHNAGVLLRADSFPPYFVALKSERTIAAHDAHRDPRTSCFSDGYLTPLGINSMLDVPIWAHGKMVGVVCHEHVGPQRMWSRDDEDFAYLVSGFVAQLLEQRSEVALPA